MTTQQSSFINKMYPIIQQVCKERGWGIPSAILAQAICESNWGKSSLSASHFNYFGMKKGSSNVPYVEYKTKEQNKDGSYVTVTAKFRKYNNMLEGIRGYFDFIETYKRYVPVMMATTSDGYIEQLKACGWATSLSYVNTLKNIRNTYNLTKYDTMTVNDKIVRVPDPTLKMGSHGDNVKLLQSCLNEVNGCRLSVDGIFGKLTEHELKVFQTEHELAIDGIYGKNSQKTLFEVLSK